MLEQQGGGNVGEHSFWSMGREYVPREDPVVHMVDTIRQVRQGGRIVLYTTEADPVVYNHPDFLDAMTQAKNRSAKIDITTASVLLVPHKRNIHNGVIILHKQGIVHVGHRGERGRGGTFLVVEAAQNSYQAYAEFPHAMLTPGAQMLRERIETLPEDRQQQRASDLLYSFDGWDSRSLVHGGIAAREENLPLIATKGNLALLVLEAERRGLVWKYMDTKDILALDAGRGLVIPFADYVPQEH